MSIIACMELRELIKKLRLRRGWSQADLAKEAGVSTGTIGTIEAENRMPYIQTLRKIADALGVSVESILRETGEIAEEKQEDETLTRMLELARKMPERRRREALRILEVIAEERE
jgi:transcriptional regulator with XRE-family HTH domain